MAELATSQLIVRNTFLHLVAKDTAEDMPRLRRSHSDHFIDYLGHKVDQSCSDCSDSTSTAADSAPCTSGAGSEVGSDDVGHWVEVVAGPPGIFTAAAAAQSINCQSTPDEDGTTVIVRKIPGDVSRTEFLDMLDAEGFAQSYTFVYLPMSFEKRVALGYAIVNFAQPTSAAGAVLRLSSVEIGGKQLEASISDAKQSMSDLILRYRDSSVMHSSVPDDFKPLIFSDGLVVPFPEPTTTLDPPVHGKDKKKIKRSA
jgi:hypothetical protein